MPFEYPPCTYRVSAKAVITVNDKLVLVKEDSDLWDLPGGGIEHQNGLEATVRREVLEETGVHLETVDIDNVDPWLTYDEEANRPLLFLVCKASAADEPVSGMHGDVEIGLFSEHDLQEVPLVKHLDKFKASLSELAFTA